MNDIFPEKNKEPLKIDGLIEALEAWKKELGNVEVKYGKQEFDGSTGVYPIKIQKSEGGIIINN